MAKKMMIVILIMSAIINSFTFSSSAQSQGTTQFVTLKDDLIDKIEMSPYMEILVDENKAWSIEDVRSENLSGQFEMNSEQIPNLGYTSSAYWVRFQLENKSLYEDWVLEIDNPTVDHVTLYYPNGSGGYDKRQAGDLYPFEQREIPHRNFVYRLEIKPEESQTLYLRFESEGAMQLAVNLWHPDSFVEKSQTEYTLLGVFYGIALVMALYNLFLYFSLRSKSYLYYVFFIISSLFIHLSFTGVAFQFIWPNAVWWNNRSIVFFMALSAIAALLFAKSFLDTRRHTPKLNRLFNYGMAFNGFIIIFLFFRYSEAVVLVVVSTAIIVCLIIITAIICSRKGYVPARYFILAWHISFVGTIISLSADAGMIPLTFLTKYAWQITAAVEFVLFSFAIANKINIIRKEKERAEQEAIRSHEIALESLKKTDKLKDEFLAATSHELRTPLHGIIGIAETMYDGATGPLTDSMKQHLSMIMLSGRKLAHIINDILDFSKLKNNELQINIKKVYLKELTDVVLTVCESLLKDKPVKLINNVDSNTPPLAADENRLQQILYNLVGNGIKHTKTGCITVRAREVDGKVEISVEDTGQGIPEEELESIFLPFQQGSYLEGEHAGTGIGLSITKRLVHLHKGTIGVTSKLGEGSTFYFTIPLFSSKVKSYEEEVAASSLPFSQKNTATLSSQKWMKDKTAGLGGKILVADDEPVNLQILINQLSLEGYDVVTVSNGKAALEKIEEEGPFHLLILDVMMPLMSGYEVCRRLRNKYSLTDLPILMLTAKNQVEDRITAFEVGANDYLAKPCDKKELLARAETLIHLQKAMVEVKEHAQELNRMNKELMNMNNLLEVRVRERTHDLEQANEELLRMEESRKHLLSNISHELGTPITYLQNYIQSVKEGIFAADNERYLSSLENKINSLNLLFQDLFDLSKFEEGRMRLKFVRVDLNKWLMQTYKSFEIDVQERGMHLNLPTIHNDGSRNIYLMIDLERMNQVFTNLIYNALKFSFSNTQISIYASVIPSARSIGKTDADFHGEVVIEVKDSGQGIKEEDIPYIFDRFYKSTNKAKAGVGSGLGLAITKEIIEYHDGEIWVESKEGVGTSFYFSLPAIISDRSTEEKLN